MSKEAESDAHPLWPRFSRGDLEGALGRRNVYALGQVLYFSIFRIKSGVVETGAIGKHGEYLSGRSYIEESARRLRLSPSLARALCHSASINLASRSARTLQQAARRHYPIPDLPADIKQWHWPRILEAVGRIRVQGELAPFDDHYGLVNLVKWNARTIGRQLPMILRWGEIPDKVGPDGANIIDMAQEP